MCHFGVTLGHFGVTLGHFGAILEAKEGTGTNLHVASGGEEGAGRVRGGCEEGAAKQLGIATAPQRKFSPFLFDQRHKAQ